MKHAHPKNKAPLSADFDGIIPADAQINTNTFLATDYLNHFNEMAMLIDMLPDMPDCIEEMEDWQELSYQDHFSASGLRYGPIAIAAYENAPAHIRARFDETVDELNAAVKEAVTSCRAAVGDAPYDTYDRAIVQHHCDKTALELKALIARVGAIINGHVSEKNDDDLAQDTVDALFDD